MKGSQILVVNSLKYVTHLFLPYPIVSPCTYPCQSVRDSERAIDSFRYSYGIFELVSLFNIIDACLIPVQAVQAVGWSRADWRLAWFGQLPPNPPPADPADEVP